ncbi:hypothetical protein Tco_0091876 [Tanacetum coccineum]
MVAYLQKPEGNEAFHQIVDFLNTSHIKCALIENPKIYTSLIQQFWGTTTARTTDDGEVKITASIDGQVKTITEASLRRRLKLEDSVGITSLPNTEIFEQLSLIGGAATTDICLEVGQGSGTMHKTPTRPYDLPLLRVHTLGSDEGSLQQNELMDLVTKLTDRVEVLENDLQQTKKVYSSALTKLILRVKKFEKQVKTNKARRRARIVISKDEDAKEDSSKQGRKISEIDKDPTILLLQEEFDRARQEQKVIAKADQAHEIDWSDPAVLRYHALQNRSFSVAEVRKNMCMYLKNQRGYKQSHFKGMSYEDIRPIFERLWDKNNAFVPKDFAIEKEVMKRPGFDLQQEST